MIFINFGYFLEKLMPILANSPWFFGVFNMPSCRHSLDVGFSAKLKILPFGQLPHLEIM